MNDEKQPEINEPRPENGATVWYDETGDLQGKIVKVLKQTIVVDYGTKISSYPKSDIKVQYYYGHLVLVAGKKEKIVHVYEK